MILLNVNFAEFGSNAFEIIILLLVIAIIAFFIGRIGRVAQKDYDLEVSEKGIIQSELADLEEEHKETKHNYLSVQQDLEEENLKNNKLGREVQKISKKIEILEGKLAQCLKKEKIPPTAIQEETSKITMRTSTIDFDRIGTASFEDKDSLQMINGIGKLIESKLNDLGIYKYKQIASFTSKDEELVNKAIKFFPGRIKRDDWRGQAKKLT